MKDILLLVAVVAFFAGGIPLMRRLDGFLNAHARPESARPQTGRRLRRNNPPSSDASCFVERLTHSVPQEAQKLKSDMECDMIGARGQAGHWRSANGKGDSES